MNNIRHRRTHRISCLLLQIVDVFSSAILVKGGKNDTKRRETDSGNNCSFNPARTCTRVQSLRLHVGMKARTFAVNRATRTRKNIFIKLSRSARVICLFVQLCNWQYISVLLGLAFSRIFFSISLRRESRGGLKVLFGGDSTRGAPINGRLEACMPRFRASFERVAHLIFDLQQQQLNWPLPHKCCSRECTSKKRKDEVQRDLCKNKKPRVASKEKKVPIANL